jgi:glycosyltransferase involved in cell wall biosynthesis
LPLDGPPEGRQLTLSLVVPAYNEERLLGDCLRAATTDVRATCARGRFEIIVVDNASTDRTAEVAAGFPGVRVVREPVKGLTRARQRGLEAACGAIVAYIDADTRMPAGWLGRVLDLFESRADVVCVSGPYVYYDLTKREATMVRAFWRLLAQPTYRLTRYMAVGGNFAASREALRRIGGFDALIAFYGEDTDIARRLAQVGKVVFDMGLVMQTSARRLHAEGLARTAARYIGNYVSEVVLKRPVTAAYRDIR